MAATSRWARCVRHRGETARQFLKELFSQPQRRVLLVCGAGFDPRSGIVAEELARNSKGQLYGIILREERGGPDDELRILAERHTQEIEKCLSGNQIHKINLFASDGAVIGGRGAIEVLEKQNLGEFTDVIIDFSDLSIGIAFPIVKFFLQAVDSLSAQRTINLHIVAIDEPWTDSEIQSISSDHAEPIFGFKGKWGLEESKGAAKLWLPQLGVGQSLRSVLGRIHTFVGPQAICPILPFSESNQRFADELMQEFRNEFENWKIDYRDIIYAHESDALDLYRTILKIHAVRTRVFAEVGGSLTILSPLGRKMVSVGILMAAIDCVLPVIYVEAVGYQVNLEKLNQSRNGRKGELRHIWLAGEPYPR